MARRSKKQPKAAAHDRDCILRAAGGALFGALPLLYTMEMWALGRTLSSALLLLLLAVTAAVVTVGLLYSGFRRGTAGYVLLDLLIVFGVAIVCAAATLLVVGQIAPGRTPLPIAVRIIAVETIPCAIGAALAITQLRPRIYPDNIDRRIHALPEDLEKALATLVGAIFFAFNIAPTEEVKKMAIEIDLWLLPVVVLFSLLASVAIVFLADFADRPPHYEEGLLANPLAETLVCYLISLAVSYGFLLAFGHVDGTTPVDFQLAMAVVLGYVTTIGAAAGRVLVAE